MIEIIGGEEKWKEKNKCKNSVYNWPWGIILTYVDINKTLFSSFLC